MLGCIKCGVSMHDAVLQSLTAGQALQGLAQLLALLQNVIELIKVPALPPVPGGVLDGPWHWTSQT